MGGLAAVITALGIIVVIYGLMQKSKANRLGKVGFFKTGEARQQAEKAAVSCEGQLAGDAHVISPVTATPCLYYELKVTAEWKDGDASRSKELASDRIGAIFGLDDGTGPVGVDPNGGGDIEPLEKSFEESRGQGLMAGLKQAWTGEPMMFGQYAVDPSKFPAGTKFSVVERVLKPQQRLFVCGNLVGGVITSKGLTSLIISNKDRDSLTAGAAEEAKKFLMGGAAAVAGGVVLGIVSKLI